MDTSAGRGNTSEHDETGETTEFPDIRAKERAFPSEKAQAQSAFQETQQLIVELLATLEHEFRTPLTVIKGYASTLLRQEQHISLEERRAFLQMIQEAGNRLERLTTRLLEIARLEAGAFQIDVDLIDILSLARKAIASAQQDIPDPLRERFTFHLHCRDEAGNQTQEVPPVKGDLLCLQKVLEHLLENAIRFSPEGGRVDVIARPVSRNRVASLPDSSFKTQPCLEICVCDFGRGIPPSELERIFDRFYRVDTGLTRETDGLGLGLTLCKYLVALHQGRIWAESCPAGGSAFHVWLPMEAQPSAPFAC